MAKFVPKALDITSSAEKVMVRIAFCFSSHYPPIEFDLIVATAACMKVCYVHH
jgi:hypothetical protein